MGLGKISIALIALLILFSVVFATSYQCTFKNQGQVNCNAYNAANSFCYLAGPGPVANNPATAVSCTNNTPSGNGTIVCQLSNYSGSAASIRCSNSTYLLSGPTIVGGTSTGTQTSSNSCTYNDCELGQISCASAYAYQECKPDPKSPGCNHWEATNCVGNAACYSSTTSQLATCAGIPSTQITTQGGVYIKTTSTTTTTTTGTTTTSTTSSNSSSSTTTSSSTAITVNGKSYYLVRSDVPNGDTGTEVCTSVGKTCVGYTSTDVSLCSKFYPSAKVVSNSVNGSKSPYYCDGAPQKELACENTYNTCAICPACNVNVTCDTVIGDQYRAMFVECTGGTATQNTELTGVMNALGIIGDARITVIDDEPATPIHYGVVVQNKTVTSVQVGDISNPNYIIEVNAAASAALKSSSDPAKTAIAEYKAGRITVKPQGVYETILVFFANIALNFS